jgi:pimeloyl-ACP methyl ester carboxylesterase
MAPARRGATAPPDRTRRLACSLGLALLCGACTLLPAPRQPRPALPPPAASAAAVADVDVVECTDLGGGSMRGVLVAGDETVRFHLRRRSAEGAPRPLVLLLPILAGGDDLLDGVALRLLEQGFDVAFCARVGSALKPPQRGPELDELFRRTVLHQRILLRWLRDGAIAPGGCFALGMSMGGMVATVLAALEPELRGVAICLAGGDLGGMMLHSTEARVQNWLAWRRTTDGVGDDHLAWEVRQFLHHEPLAFAPCVPTAKVLFVSAAFDTVVPPRNQDLLWEALGRPARMVVPLGHYTAALAIDPILRAAAAHFRGRCPPAP